MKQFKSLSLSVKGVDQAKGIIEGYASAFGNVDSDGDMIRKGAFAKTIMERGPQGKNQIFHLAQHNPTQILGKPIELIEDDYGLKFVSQISKTQLGMDYIQLYMDEIINEHSIGFNTLLADSEGGANVIKEVKLWEYSAVTWGANEMTPTLSAKTATEYLDTLYKAYYKGTYTDDTFEMIAKQIDQLKDFIQSLDKKDVDTERPSVSDLVEPTSKQIDSFILNLQKWKI